MPSAKAPAGLVQSEAMNGGTHMAWAPLGLARASRTIGQFDTPFFPMSEGVSIRPLHWSHDGSGFVIIALLQQGAEFPLHRVMGEYHSMNIEGYRLTTSGEVVEPGDYVFGKAGDVDRWQAIGNSHCSILIVVSGHIHFLGPRGNILGNLSATDIRSTYRHHCEQEGFHCLDLG